MLKKTVEFLFELGMLKKTPRTGYQFLGSGGESVADHTFRTSVIGYVLASRRQDADRTKIMIMCLFHDLPEARTGDHNYENKKYVKVDEMGALRDQVQDLGFGNEVLDLFREFNEGKTLEARLARDADQLDFILELKKQIDLGNPNAQDWLNFAIKRLVTNSAVEIAQEILTTDSSDWWFDKKTDWWVNGPENQNKDA